MLAHFHLIWMPDSPLGSAFFKAVSSCLLAGSPDRPPRQLGETIPYKVQPCQSLFPTFLDKMSKRETVFPAASNASTIIYKNQKGESFQFLKMKHPACQQVFQAAAIGCVQQESTPTIAPSPLPEAFQSLKLPWGEMESRNPSY